MLSQGPSVTQIISTTLQILDVGGTQQNCVTQNRTQPIFKKTHGWDARVFHYVMHMSNKKTDWETCTAGFSLVSSGGKEELSHCIRVHHGKPSSSPW